jgi:PTS system mannitol-specific IIC component
MITTVIIVLTIVIIVGVFILDHFAIQREKEAQEAARVAREERRAAKKREQELTTVKATGQSGTSETISNAKKETADGRTVDLRTMGHITFACDAGMGSSAMGAVVLQRKLEAAGLGNIVVQHCAINKIPEDARYIVCPKEFAIQVADTHRRARIIPIDEFMDAPEYDKIVASINSSIGMIRPAEATAITSFAVSPSPQSTPSGYPKMARPAFLISPITLSIPCGIAR